MADKLLPGIPHPTRIAILQQTDSPVQGGLEGEDEDNRNKTVLEYVLSSDRYRNDLIRKIDCKSSTIALLFITCLIRCIPSAFQKPRDRRPFPASPCNP